MLLLLAAALIKPALGFPADTDPNLQIQLPAQVSTIEAQAMADHEAEKNRTLKDVSLNTSFFSRPDLTFSDSFARSEHFAPTNMPSIDIAMEQPNLWKVKGAYIGFGSSIGLATWSAVGAKAPHNLFETPLSVYARSSMPLVKHLSIFSKVGVHGSLYWSDYSTQFESFNGWGRGIDGAAGLEFPFKTSVASLSATFTHETRDSNSTHSIGMRLGWGIVL